MLLATLALTSLVTAAAPSPAPAPMPTASPAAPAPPVPSAQPLPSPVAAPPPSAAVTAKAKDWLHRLQTAQIDRAQFDARMNTALTDDIVKQAASQLGPLGDPTAFTYVEAQAAGDYVSYIYRVTFKTATINWIYTLDKQGKIAGLHAQPVGAS